jgi:uncharacterized LabA/DUF88 family protein
MYKDSIELAEDDPYDKAILVSGDSYFLDVGKKLKELKKKLKSGVLKNQSHNY